MPPRRRPTAAGRPARHRGDLAAPPDQALAVVLELVPPDLLHPRVEALGARGGADPEQTRVRRDRRPTDCLQCR
ncbi:hypothetical protein ACIF70_19105 [Actinacidiphila glaucinigra]|uniref:hypothetical protein n=1 Tax=Actinacidiphila glaucinigra TaxID=235986 RepID=UPI0037C5C3CA